MTKQTWIRSITVTPMLLLTLFAFCIPTLADTPCTASVFFSPQGGITAVITREIAASHDSIYLQAYSFTSAPIAKALLEAAKRGVAVSVLLDPSQAGDQYSSYTFLKNNGIAVKLDAAHLHQWDASAKRYVDGLAHNKIIILDESTVITGSFNFTKSAEMFNAENIVILKSVELAREYLANWRVHAAHSRE